MEIGAIFKARITAMNGNHYDNVRLELPHGVDGLLHYTDDIQRLKVGDTLVVRIRQLWLAQPEQRGFVCVELV
jgi:hypothetical protein